MQVLLIVDIFKDLFFITPIVSRKKLYCLRCG